MLEHVRTTCPYCGCGCELHLVVEDGELLGVMLVDGSDDDKAALCVKGWNAWQFVQDPERLRTPLIRRNGELQPATWDEAIKATVDGIQSVQSRFGEDSMVFLSSAKMTNEENYAFMRLVRAGFGTNNIDHCARL